jgi:nucleoid-associated protein YgaU
LPQLGTYEVREGDNLSRIAERAYGRQVWPLIYRANRKQINDPNLIYPGQVLTVPTRK